MPEFKQKSDDAAIAETIVGRLFKMESLNESIDIISLLYSTFFLDDFAAQVTG